MKETPLNQEIVLERINEMQRDLELLKREVICRFASPAQTQYPKPSLFGSVKGQDVTEAMVEEAKHSLFQDLEDI